MSQQTLAWLSTQALVTVSSTQIAQGFFFPFEVLFCVYPWCGLQLTFKVSCQALMTLSSLSLQTPTVTNPGVCLSQRPLSQMVTVLQQIVMKWIKKVSFLIKKVLIPHSEEPHMENKLQTEEPIYFLSGKDVSLSPATKPTLNRGCLE